MAILVGAGDLLHLRVWTTLVEQATCTNFYYRVIQVVPNAFLEDWALGFDTYFHTPFKSVMAPGPIYEGTQLATVGQDGESASAVSGQHKGPGVWPGGGGPLPWQTRGLCHARVPLLAGKGGHLRKFIPWPDVVIHDPANGQPMLTYQQALQSLATLMGPAVTITVKGVQGQCMHSLYRRKTGDVIDAPPMTAATRWATQRRAGQFGKPNASPV